MHGLGDIRYKLGKVAIAMHCNLRPSDVASVILSFNIEAYNAPAYNSFNNFTPHRPIMHAHTKFQRSRTMRSEVIDDSTTFVGQFLRRNFPTPTPELEEQYTSNLGS